MQLSQHLLKFTCVTAADFDDNDSKDVFTDLNGICDGNVLARTALPVPAAGGSLQNPPSLLQRALGRCREALLGLLAWPARRGRICSVMSPQNQKSRGRGGNSLTLYCQP